MFLGFRGWGGEGGVTMEPWMMDENMIGWYCKEPTQRLV